MTRVAGLGVPSLWSAQSDAQNQRARLLTDARAQHAHRHLAIGNLACSLLGLVAELLDGIVGVLPADHVGHPVLATVHVDRHLAAKLDAPTLNPLLGRATLAEAVVLQ